MKRDMELIRKILLFVESIESTTQFELLKIDGYSFDAICHHVELLIGQGLLRAELVEEDYDGISIGADAMTYEGHDFLDAARNDTIWRKAMDKVAGTTGSVSVDVLKAILADLGKKAFGL